MASQNQLAFRKWWWLIPIAVAIGLAGAFGSLHLVQKEYKAVCGLFVGVPRDTGSGESYQAQQFAQARVASYLELIKGRRVAEGAINYLQSGLSPGDLEKDVDALEKRIDAKAEAESVLIDVSVTDPQPQRSADLANAVCKSFLAEDSDAEPNPLVDITLIEYAQAPQSPASPSPKRYLALGAITGLLLGIGLVVSLGRIQRERKRPSGATQPETDATSQVPLGQPQQNTAGEDDSSGTHRAPRHR
jgi:capsular polysaccharide biosynthesis protein